MVSGNDNNHYWQVLLAVKSQYFRISHQERMDLELPAGLVARPLTSRDRRTERAPACSHQSGWVIRVVVRETDPAEEVDRARRRGQRRWRHWRLNRSRGGLVNDEDRTSNTSRFFANARGRRRCRAVRTGRATCTQAWISCPSFEASRRRPTGKAGPLHIMVARPNV